MISQNIWRIVDDNALNEIAPSNFSQFSFCLHDFIKIDRLLLAAVSINGLATQRYISKYFIKFCTSSMS